MAQTLLCITTREQEEHVNTKRKQYRSSTYASVVCLLSCFVGFYCTDVGLQPLTRQVQIDGEYNTSTASMYNVPVKILMICDTSQSMQVTDPTLKRGQAVADLVTYFSNSGQKVSIGFIGFDTTAAALSDGFLEIIPENLGDITTAIAGLNAAKGFTNYISALDAAATMVADDIHKTEEALHEAEQNGEDITNKRPWYFAVFFSDGLPRLSSQDHTNQDTPSILFKVNRLVTIRSDAILGITLHTAFLGGMDATTEDAAKTLLEQMAAEGRGSFFNFSNGDDIDFRLFEFEIKRLFKIKEFMVVNRNAVLVGDMWFVDSDADGLADEHEDVLGTDSTNPDSDTDGLRDGFEVRTKLDPLKYDYVCESDKFLDTDNDGLNDCEELYINLNPEKFDTDDDGFPDHYEFFSNADPKDGDDVERDPDWDFVNTRDEILRRTDPKTADPKKPDYAYSINVRFESDAETGSVRYFFTVSNVSLMSTKATAQHAAGVNQLEVYVNQVPSDMSNRVHMLYKKSQNVRTAADLDGAFLPENFTHVSTQETEPDQGT